MKAGERVHWSGVNRIESGVLKSEQKDGDWLVLLDNGKYVIVNENQIL